MGHKVHPMGFRIGVIRGWQANWYADKHYAEFLQEDLKLRQAIQSRYNEAGISLVEIHRQANKVMITIHTARPGVVIGRGGQRVDEMRHHLEHLIGQGTQLNILEIPQPELDAYLVAKAIAEQIVRRVAYRRAMKQAIFRTLQAGAKGIRVSCAGRLAGAEIARRQTMHQGQVPLHTLRADIDYGFTEAHTTLGRIGVKVWIYKGDILPEPKPEVEETPTKLAEKTPEPVEPAPVELEEKPAEAIEDKEKVEVTESASVETKEKPKKRVGRAKKVEAVASTPVKLEEKPTKPKPTRRAKRAKDTDSTPVESKEKPTKPKPTRRAKRAKDTDSTPVESKEKDATTQTSEIPQDS